MFCIYTQKRTKMLIEGLNTDNKVFIIAEIGNNHEGDFNLAQEMIAQAAEAGVNAVKFQTIIPELLVDRSQQERIARLQKFQFTYEQFEILAKTAKDNNVVFCSTPFDLQSASFLNSIQSVFKIASGDNNFFPLIDHVAAFCKPIIISTGLSNMDLLKNLHNRVTGIWANANVTPGLAFLHCLTSYPTPVDQAGLSSIFKLREEFPQLVIGYSDHTMGIDASLYSVVAGARIVEKHFTIDKNHSDFRDHQLSADPVDMRNLVDGIREIELMFGEGPGEESHCEKDMHAVARRSIAAAVDLPVGTVLEKDHLIWVRPGTGMAPGEESKLLGRKVITEKLSGEIFAPTDVI